MPGRPATNAHLANLLAEARAVLDAEYGQGPSLAAVARSIATSPRQLERAFAEVGGTTFRAELTATRLRHAVVLLVESPMTIAQVAAAVGYSQPPHFAKAFRRRYGASPSAWRRAEERRAPAEVEARRQRWAEAQRLAHARAVEEQLRRWAEARLEDAAREGRSAWPRAIRPPED